MLNRDDVKKFKAELAMLLNKYGLSNIARLLIMSLRTTLKSASRTSIQPYLKLWLGMTRRGERPVVLGDDV